MKVGELRVTVGQLITGLGAITVIVGGFLPWVTQDVTITVATTSTTSTTPYTGISLGVGAMYSGGAVFAILLSYFKWENKYSKFIIIAEGAFLILWGFLILSDPPNPESNTNMATISTNIAYG